MTHGQLYFLYRSTYDANAVSSQLETYKDSVHNVYGAVCDIFSSQTLSGFGLCLRVRRNAMMMSAGARIWSGPHFDWEHFLACTSFGFDDLKLQTMNLFR